MRRIRSKGMKPEMLVRRLVHGLGYRYRLHIGNLPGRPDLVFASRHKVIFVHGCFWHQHEDCPISRLPKSRQDYWIPKLERNKQRDEQHKVQLRKLGWKSLIVWECETEKLNKLTKKLQCFLES